MAKLKGRSVSCKDSGWYEKLQLQIKRGGKWLTVKVEERAFVQCIKSTENKERGGNREDKLKREKERNSESSLAAATCSSRYGRATNEKQSPGKKSANGSAPLNLAPTTAVSKLGTAAANQPPPLLLTLPQLMLQ